MLSLREYRNKADRLADFLPWATLVAPGVVVNKDGSFQRSARFRGPDLDSATPAELIATTARLNSALRRLGSGWAIFVEAVRRPALDYPGSAFPDPASALVEQERAAQFAEEGAHFESGYFLTLLWMPPAEDAARAESWLYEGKAEKGINPKELLDLFIDRTDPALAVEKLRLVEKVIQGRDFTVIVEGMNAVEAWLGSLPGHVYANVRQPPISTLNLAHMIPLSAVWAGPERDEHFKAAPLFYARTEGSTPFRFSLHVGDVGHTLIVGPTGAGKSVLLALMALQFRRYDRAQVFAFDFGGSIRAAAHACGGDWQDLGTSLSDDGAGAVLLQPLARIDEPAERNWAAEWLQAILAAEGVTIDPPTKEHLWSALTSLSTAPVAERTLTGLAVLLQSQTLKQALAPYCIGGPFGRLLDAEAEHLGEASFQAFETEGLTGSAAAPAVLAYLFHRIEGRLDGSPTMIIIDEGWLVLDSPAFAAQLREWLKTLRKKNASVVFATQSLADIETSAIAPAIIESCPTRIFLPNERAVEPQILSIYRRFGLNDRQIEIVARATPKRDYYCQSARGMAERVLGNIVSSGIKVLVLAVIVGIGSTIFTEFTSAIGAEPTIEDALSIMLASLSLLGLGIFGPGIANGIVSGGPQLGAGAAAGTALLAGGAAAGAVAGARMAGGAVASAASNVAHGSSRAAGGATMAYALGSAGKSGASAVGSGVAAVGDAAVGAATSPLRKAGDSMKQSFREGSRSTLDAMAGPIKPGPNTPPATSPAAADQGQPAWAKAMKDRQTIAHGATIAAHTLKSGDSHGGGASIDTSEKD